jgi:peptidoglycan biosynthesis protein MviN/MurJ (putative lipid II flippase)
VRGLAIAFMISGYFNFFILWQFLKKKFVSLTENRILPSLGRVGLSAVVAGLAIVGVLRLADVFLDTHTVLGLFIQAALSFGAGLLVYLLILSVWQAPEMDYLKKFFRSRKSGVVQEEVID